MFFPQQLKALGLWGGSGQLSGKVPEGFRCCWGYLSLFSVDMYWGVVLRFCRLEEKLFGATGKPKAHVVGFRSWFLVVETLQKEHSGVQHVMSPCSCACFLSLFSVLCLVCLYIYKGKSYHVSKGVRKTKPNTLTLV